MHDTSPLSRFRPYAHVALATLAAATVWFARPASRLASVNPTASLATAMEPAGDEQLGSTKGAASVVVTASNISPLTIARPAQDVASAATHNDGARKPATADLALVEVERSLLLPVASSPLLAASTTTPDELQPGDLLAALPAAEPIVIGSGAVVIDLNPTMAEIVVAQGAIAERASATPAEGKLVLAPQPLAEKAATIEPAASFPLTIAERQPLPTMTQTLTLPETLDWAPSVDGAGDIVRALDEYPLEEIAAVQTPADVPPPPASQPHAAQGAPAEALTPAAPAMSDAASAAPPGGDELPAEPPVELPRVAGVVENATCPCGEAGCPGTPCSPGAGCHEDPGAAFPSSVQSDVLELLAVDVARRSLLALHPYAASEPIITLEVVVRPEGHIVHTYARLQWHRRHWWNVRGPAKVYESEVSASVVYHPDHRRVFDVSYVDNAYLPFRNIDMTSQVTASYNEDFALRDGTGLPPKFLSDRVDVLEPYVKPRIFNFGPVREPDPRAKQLRVVRRDSNVTANQ